MLILLLCAALAAAQPSKLVTVTDDDTVLTESCTVVILKGSVITDANDNGVIQINADNITVTFTGAPLRGAPEATPWDQLKGIGVRINGHKNVTLKGLNVSGFKVAIRASNADGLTIDGAELNDNYRQHLGSTPAAEDSSDWLFPHENDNHEWVENHGAALCVESSNKVSISNITVRRGQNGIILDRVNDSKIFGNDCSFLSGWGLAMWRSSRNTVSRNALDFCVRGYSHGVYNRGQDSAGILMFEQCNDNTLIENSATHGGDGFFGFAGKEAIGETPSKAPGFDPIGKGNNNNLLIDNDFSDAAAHGIEMTFSYGNRFIRNRLANNAICGIWGGYSQDTTIAFNTISGNGTMAYGLERGGINIEHGSGNSIIENQFSKNACGVHLWWDNDSALLARPAIKAKNRGISKNIIANNTFEGDAIALQLRDLGTENFKDNVFSHNTTRNVGKEIEATKGAEPRVSGEVSPYAPPTVEAIGRRKVVGARSALAGRAFIIMTEWGPYEHVEPMVRTGVSMPGTRVYELFRIPPDSKLDLKGTGLQGTTKKPEKPGLPVTYTVNATIPGVVPYTLELSSKSFSRTLSGSIFNATWDATFFEWDEASDPRTNLAAWRARAESPASIAARLPALDLSYNSRGPSALKLSEEITKAALKPDHFGMIATTSVAIPKGIWKITTLSDDGVRVRVNNKVVIENWTWHGPTRDTGVFTMDADGTAEFVVEHFEIDGAAVLKVEIEPAL